MTNNSRSDFKDHKMSFRCDKCRRTFNSQSEAEKHFNSSEHAQRSHDTYRQARTAMATGNHDDVGQISLPPELEYVISEQPNAFFCTLCKCPCTGLAPIMEHVRSAKHIKNKECLRILTNQTTPENKFSHNQAHFSSLPVETTPQRAPHYGTAQAETLQVPPEVTPYGNLDLSMFDINPMTNQFVCKCCNVSMSGEVPAAQHIEGSKHMKKYKAWLFLQKNPRTVSVKEMKHPEDETAHLLTPPKAAEVIDTNLAALNELHDEKLFDVFEHISLDGKMRCKVCDIEVTGREPALQHVRGKSHGKALNAAKFRKASAISSVSPTVVTSPETIPSVIAPPTSSTPEEKNYPPNKLQTVEEGQEVSMGSLQDRFKIMHIKDNSRTVLPDNFWQQSSSYSSNISSLKSRDPREDTSSSMMADPDLEAHIQLEFKGRADPKLLQAVVHAVLRYQWDAQQGSRNSRGSKT